MMGCLIRTEACYGKAMVKPWYDSSRQNSCEIMILGQARPDPMIWLHFLVLDALPESSINSVLSLISRPPMEQSIQKPVNCLSPSYIMWEWQFFFFYVFIEVERGIALWSAVWHCQVAFQKLLLSKTSYERRRAFVICSKSHSTYS